MLDRPNPLGGEVVEGNLRARQASSRSWAPSALPVRHGLTLGEIVRLEGSGAAGTGAGPAA